MAWYILRAFDPRLKIEDAKKHFAHANSAKCCMNKQQNGMADSVLFRNCQGYLKRELEILDPKIVVSQGDKAKNAIQQLLECRLSTIDKFSSIIRLNGKEVFWLHTYHPRRVGEFYQHRRFNWETREAEGWVFYAERIHHFIMGGNA
ncbi:MAG: hypothetical protein IT369_17100 [Candidatus Latescibacteria bacterium]|nr:hypothetical protein [Candidatus Latescibacterota bacterium]